MSTALDWTVNCPYYADTMSDSRAALRQALDAIPASTRALAEEAGVDEKLLRMIRDGERRLTPETRDALVGALRRWGGRLDEAGEALEAVDLEQGGDGA